MFLYWLFHSCVCQIPSVTVRRNIGVTLSLDESEIASMTFQFLHSWRNNIISQNKLFEFVLFHISLDA